VYSQRKKNGKEKAGLEKGGRSPKSSDHVRVPFHVGSPVVKILFKLQG